MRIDSHVCYSPEHPPEHLQSILARNRFDGALLVVDDPSLPPLPPHILGLIVRRGDSPSMVGAISSLADLSFEAAARLADRNLPLDVEMHTADFPALLELAGRLPNLRIAIDHLARPPFASGISAEWAGGMEAAAAHPQIFCKISGLLTEETLPWSADAIRPFVQHAIAVFGPGRLMFGSEWPRRLPEVIWKEALAAFTQAIGPHTQEFRELLLGETARRFYLPPGT